MGELDSDTSNVSIYLDDEDEVSFTAFSAAKLLGSQAIALTQLGKRLKELNVPENSIIRVYASVDWSASLRAKVRESLVNDTANFSNLEFFRRVEE